MSFAKDDFFQQTGKPAKFIALGHDYQIYDEGLFDCECLLVAYEDMMFLIESQTLGYDDFGYKYSYLSDYKPVEWPIRIEASDEEPIVFVREEREPDVSPSLRFMKGSRPILTTPDEYSIMIGLTHWDENGDWIEYSDNSLI